MAQPVDALDLSIKIEQDVDLPTVVSLAKERDDLADELKTVLIAFKKVWKKLQQKPRAEREQLILLTQQRDNIAKDLQVATEKLKELTKQHHDLQQEHEKLVHFKQKFEYEMIWYKADIDNMNNTYQIFQDMLNPEFWNTASETSTLHQEPTEI